MVMKELISKSLFLLWEGMVILKELIFNILYSGGCGGLERTDF